MVHIITREEYHSQKKVDVYGKEDCPLCDGADFDPDLLITETKYWRIFHAKSPYSGTKHHLMASPRKHKKFARELTKKEHADLHQVFAFIDDYYGEEDYFQTTRLTMANRSVEHYHMHFIPGKCQGKYLRYMLMHQGFPIEQEITPPDDTN